MSFELNKSVKIIRHKLNNGLEVIILNNPKVPIVSMNLSYKVGSKDEIVGIRGFAHLFEHLMFEGSKNVPKGEFDKICSSAGGTNNAYTTYDYTAYTMTLPSHQIELGLWLESDRMFYSEISQSALETQQKVVTEEILQTIENQPYGKWRENLAALAYSPECSYSWEVHGSKEDVANSTLANVQNFFNTYYNPENACLVLAGDCPPENTMPLVEKYFGIEKSNGNIRRNIFVENFKQKGKTEITYDNVPLPAVFISFHLGDFKSEDIYTADVLSYMIGNGRSSELYKKLVYEMQIASQVGAFVDKREHCSLLTFYAVGNKPLIQTDELKKAILFEIEKVKKGLFDESSLFKTRNQLTSQIANEIQYSHGLADMIGNFTLFWNNPEMIFEVLGKYNAINREHLIEFADKYLVAEEAIEVVVLPKEMSDNEI
ncbi:MAG: insulinase family protein [Candidatus Kapabacteria bacterium]|nr:insulinase family protein [Ignavibacteriota bacterium]MCW5883665.1 insulinase family protein [Candidatus Kapabacteria bacterium]